MNIEQLKTIELETRVHDACKKAEETNAVLNALVSMIDPEEQLNQLPKEGLLHGIPVILKDVVNMKGTVTTGSSAILDNYVSVYDATIVEKLKAAGAVMIAKSSCDTFGMGGTNMTAHTGPVLNPYDLSRISGGSSGGSAVVVASGVVPMAIGTDTGDSIRKPASFNNIVGFKPSYGRISRYGIIPYASSLDHVGVFTRNVKDAALSLSVLAGRDNRDMTSLDLPVEAYHDLIEGKLEGRRFGVIQNVVDAIKHSETRIAFENLLKQLEEKGAIIEWIKLDERLMEAYLPTYYILANAEATANHSNLDSLRFGVLEEGSTMEENMILSRTSGFNKLIRKRFVIGSYALFTENQERLFRKAQKIRRLIVEDIKQALSNCDVLIAPASGQGAPKLQDDLENKVDELSNEYLVAENYMVMANFSGYPSITLPFTMTDGMPVGVNLTCGAFEDLKCLDIAYGVEKVSGLADQIKEVTR